MAHEGIRRGILFVLAAFVLFCSPLRAQATTDEQSDGPIVPDQAIPLPDGSPLPDLPVSLMGKWDNGDASITTWQADLAVKNGEFAGKITFPNIGLVVPLTVQGTRNGDIVEFSVRFQKNEVAYFAGYLAGTSLVGTFEGINGQKGDWSGSWFPETLEVQPGASEDDVR
jgi:hypothetical protein